jgi:hypothetical protein
LDNPNHTHFLPHYIFLPKRDRRCICNNPVVGNVLVRLCFAFFITTILYVSGLYITYR